MTIIGADSSTQGQREKFPSTREQQGQKYHFASVLLCSGYNFDTSLNLFLQ